MKSNQDGWVKVSAVRIKNGKLQLKNPTTYYGGVRADKAGWLKEIFGTKTVSYRGDLKRARRGTSVSIVRTPIVSTGLSKNQKDVIEALVGQGAKRGEAKKVVSDLGDGNFDSLFRKALKEF